MRFTASARPTVLTASGRLGLAVAGFVAARAGLRVARFSADDSRRNYRGRTVSLAGGPVLCVAASATAAWGAAAAGRPDLARAVLLASVAAGAVGRYDDVAAGTGASPAKGLRGHLGALGRGRVTTGVVKLAGLAAAGVLAAAALPSRRTGGGRVTEVILGAGLIAGSANLINLLDLRPGRALKAALVVAIPLAATARTASTPGGVAPALAGPVGAAIALLPEDLAERVMLGDAGANALGAVLGVAAVARTGIGARALALAVVAGLTLASERWSFTQVIEANPVLRRWDRLGTLPFG